MGRWAHKWSWTHVALPCPIAFWQSQSLWIVDNHIARECWNLRTKTATKRLSATGSSHFNIHRYLGPRRMAFYILMRCSSFSIKLYKYQLQVLSAQQSVHVFKSKPAPSPESGWLPYITINPLQHWKSLFLPYSNINFWIAVLLVNSMVSIRASLRLVLQTTSRHWMSWVPKHSWQHLDLKNDGKNIP